MTLKPLECPFKRIQIESQSVLKIIQSKQKVGWKEGEANKATRTNKQKVHLNPVTSIVNINGDGLKPEDGQTSSVKDQIQYFRLCEPFSLCQLSLKLATDINM